MSDSKHTPGPWRITKFSTAGRTIENSERVIAIVKTHNILRLRAQSYFDAQLIAAAPVLLEALKGMIEAGHLGVKLNVRKSEHFSWMNAEACARKAVLQAEGG